jgi:hypothetical protein
MQDVMQIFDVPTSSQMVSVFQVSSSLWHKTPVTWNFVITMST